MDFLQAVVLGLLQGIFEWLPISSSGFIALIFSNVFMITDIDFILQNTLMLHLGTFFAALIYFRKDVTKLFLSLFHYQKIKTESPNKKTLNFLIAATIISGLIGFGILKLIQLYEDKLSITGKAITLIIAVLLLITGLLQLKPKNKGIKKEKDLKFKDGILLGLLQGISVLPGLSRSGMTVSGLLLRKFDDTSSLRLSFLMSLPIVLAANIFLNINNFIFTPTAIFGLVASFAFGLATISGLMKLSKKINFGWFVLIFAVLMGVSILF